MTDSIDESRIVTDRADANFSNNSLGIDSDIKPMTMVRCPSCGETVEEHMNYCDNCNAAFRKIEIFSIKQLLVGLSIWFAIIMFTQIATLILFEKPFYGSRQWEVYILPTFFGTTWLSRFLALKFVKPLYKVETMLTQEEEQSMCDAYDKLTKRNLKYTSPTQ